MNPTDVKPLGRLSAAFALSASCMVVVNTLLACAKDKWDAVQQFITPLTGHHWSAQGIIIIFGFILLGVLFSRGKALQFARPDWIIRVLLLSVLFSSVLLAGWYFLF